MGSYSIESVLGGDIVPTLRGFEENFASGGDIFKSFAPSESRKDKYFLLEYPPLSLTAPSRKSVTFD